MWIPQPVKGYSAGEVRAAAENGLLSVGMSKWDLDTPALSTSKRSPAMCRNKPSAIWLLAEFPVQRTNTRFRDLNA